jgi:hypothetical protein
MLNNLNFLRKQVEFVLLQDPPAYMKLSSSAAISRLNVAIARLSAATLSLYPPPAARSWINDFPTAMVFRVFGSLRPTRHSA